MKKLNLILLMLPVMAVWSCKKSSTTPTTTTPTPTSTAVTVNSTPQYSFKADGTTYSKVEDGSSVTVNLSADRNSGVNPGDSGSATYASSFDDAGGSVTYFSVSKSRLKFPALCSGCTALYPANSDFKAFFNTRSYSYGNGLTVYGIELTWRDNSGVQWSTSMGSGNQSGSSFSITDMKDMSQLGNYYVVIKASFNCTLYNSVGQSKILTEGIVVTDFENM